MNESPLGGRYRIEGTLGRGAMGTVVRARDLELDRPVAIKIAAGQKVDPSVLPRFTQEARLTARLVHPHVIRLLDQGVAGTGELFIVYELVTGGDLAARLASPEPLPGPTALDWCQALASALAAAHRAGILHRDVKPANIMLQGGEHLLLGDFGLARAELDGVDLTATGVMVGTMLYLAPELVAGKAGHSEASDQFAWACVAHEILYRTKAQRDDDLRDRMARPGRPPGVRLGGPLGAHPGIDPILARALAAEPSRRFPSMGEIEAALAAHREGTRAATQSSPRRPGRRPRPAEPCLPRRPGLLSRAATRACRPGGACSAGWPRWRSACWPAPVPGAPPGAQSGARPQRARPRPGRAGARLPPPPAFPLERGRRIRRRARAGPRLGHRAQLLDARFPLVWSHYLEGLEAWLGALPPGALDQDGAQRERAVRFLVTVPSHALEDLAGLLRIPQASVLGLAGPGPAGFDFAAWRSNRDGLAKETAGFLARLDRRAPPPPDLVLASAGQLAAYLELPAGAGLADRIAARLQAGAAPRDGAVLADSLAKLLRLGDGHSFSWADRARLAGVSCAAAGRTTDPVVRLKLVDVAVLESARAMALEPPGLDPGPERGLARALAVLESLPADVFRREVAVRALEILQGRRGLLSAPNTRDAGLDEALARLARLVAAPP